MPPPPPPLTTTSAAMQMVFALLGQPPPPRQTKANANKTAAGAPLKVKVNTSVDEGDDVETAEAGELKAVEEAAEILASWRAVAKEAAVLIDMKDPTCCLCWSLVRRGLRDVGRA